MIEMSLEDHDNQTIYCRMLGHEVPFAYCRQGAGAIPCRKIFDCWYHMFDIQAFMKEHFTEDQINHILSPPKPKMTTLIELIQQAQENAKKKGTDIDG